MSFRRPPPRVPRWMGLFGLLLGGVFAVVGYLIATADREEGTLLFGALFVVFGLVAIGMGAFMLGLRLPFGWLWRGQVRDVVAADGMLWTAYPRPVGARLWDVAGPVIGAAFALLFVALALRGPVGETWLFVLAGIGFLAIMVPASVLGLRRSVSEPDSLRVGWPGLWMPSVGVVPWSEVESVGVVDAAATMTHEGETPMNQALRLTIRLKPGAPVRGRTGIDRYLLFGSPRQLGVYEYQLPVPLEDVLARIERYHPVETGVASAGDRSS